MIQGGSEDVSQVTVSGVVCDSLSEITAFTINGAPVVLTGTPPCQTFTTQLDSRWGLNILEAKATNKTGYTHTTVQSYIRSPQFHAPPTAAASRSSAAAFVPGAVHVRLNQDAIDDGVRGTLANPNADDIATALWLVLNGIDLNAALPAPLVNDRNASQFCDCVWPIADITLGGTGYVVDRGNFSFGGFSIDYVDPTSTGLEMGASAGVNGSIRLPVTVRGYLNEGCVIGCVTRGIISGSASGVITLDDIVLDGDVRVRVDNGAIRVDVTNVVVDLVGLVIDVDWGLIDFLFDFIGLSALVTAIVNAFDSEIESAIASAIHDQAGPVIEDMLNAISVPPVQTLPPPLGKTLNIDRRFDAIATAAAPLGFVHTVLSLDVSSTGPSHPGALGPIARAAGAVPVFSSSAYEMGVAVKDDFLNQVLYASWWGGAFDLQDLSGLGCNIPEGATARITALPPPVVMPGTNGHDIDIGVGDIHILVSLAQPPNGAPDIELYVSGVAGASLDIDPVTNELLLSFDASPEVFVEVVTAPGDADLAELAEEYSTLFECVYSELLSMVFSSIPIPTIDIGTIGLQGIPAGTRLRLQNGDLSRQDPFWVLTGDVEED